MQTHVLVHKHIPQESPAIQTPSKKYALLVSEYTPTIHVRDSFFAFTVRKSVFMRQASSASVFWKNSSYNRDNAISNRTQVANMTPVYSATSKKKNNHNQTLLAARSRYCEHTVHFVHSVW